MPFVATVRTVRWERSVMMSDKYDLQAVEAKWRAEWERPRVNGARVYAWNPTESRDTSYVIDTPPPTVSGYLHMGHIYSYTQTDLIARFQRMAGKNVCYPIGFDDNGLPTERLVEKVRGIRAADMSRADFIKICHEVVQESEQDFRNLFSAIALSVDWALEYQTISPHSMKTSQSSVLDLFNKGHLSRKPQPSLWDPADRTALAQAEVVEKEMPGFMWDVNFGLEGGGTVTIATTRPELIGACGALLIHPEHPKAGELLGKNAISPLYGVPVPILADEKADPEKGTGIVMCCTFGDTTDIEWWHQHSLPTRVIVDHSGRMTDMPDFGGADWPSVDLEKARETIAAVKGLTVKQAKTKVVELLEAAGVLGVKQEVKRMVPCAERSGAPLEIIVTPQWFVKVLDKKAALIEKGRQINWHPDYMRVRYEIWVENLKWDWCISRQRYFGVPFPFWYSKRPGEEGKILAAHPDDLPVNPLVDLPRGYEAHEVEPDPDVMDTWATSSVSPQINSHGVAEGLMIDPDRHAKLFPSHLRPQAHEIIRTWAFYTIVKAMLHEDKAPWQDIAISGWCLAEDRSKMSKSKGNVVTPHSLLEKYGADCVRYWTATSRLGLDTALSEDVLKIGKRLTTKLWNAARFVGGHIADLGDAPTTPKADADAGLVTGALDKWILAKLARTLQTATEENAKYEYADALNAVERFFWDAFCDNYLELVKGRAYGDVGGEADKASARYALFHTLETVLRLFAPVLPFMTEEIYQGLFTARHDKAGSIHARGYWPKAEDMVIDEAAEAAGDAAVAILAAVRKAKSLAKVSLKTPVARLTIAPGPSAPANVAALLAPVKDDLLFAGGVQEFAVVDSLPEGGESLDTEDGAFRILAVLAAPTA